MSAPPAVPAAPAPATPSRRRRTAVAATVVVVVVLVAVVIGEREAVTMGHTSGFGDRLRDSLFISDAEPPPSRFAQVP